MSDLDTSSDPRFTNYYEKESQSEQTLQRFSTLQDKVLGLRTRQGAVIDYLRVLDIGCGAGTQCRIWANDGHIVSGIDLNEALITIATKRAEDAGLPIAFQVASATKLPFPDDSFDICLMPELLEHVEDWQSCVNEAVRVLTAGGVLFLSTTNRLCPRQQEFNLPLYSWYPSILKRRYERLAKTTRPGLANFARYPAVHWFTYAQLSRFLGKRCVLTFDRFDMITTERMSRMKRLAATLVKSSSIVRFLGHVCTEGTAVFGVKC